MRLVATLIAVFLGAIPVVTFVWGYSEGMERRLACPLGVQP